MSARVVIAGGGVAALEAVLALRALGGDELDIEVIAPEQRFVYRPFIVATPFDGSEPWSYDLDVLLGYKGVRHRRDALASVDPHARVVTTRRGAGVPYDALLVAMGARPFSAVAGAITFAGMPGVDAVRTTLADVQAGAVHSIVFAVPWGVAWSLPLYELALLTRAHLEHRGFHPRLAVVSPEPDPLSVFGALPSQAMRTQLEEHAIFFRTAHPIGFRDGVLHVVPEDEINADRVIAMPLYRGPAIAGLPSDDGGFLPTDELGSVRGTDRVWAAGDATDFPVKQGGLAAQEADVAAAAIAHRLGLAGRPRPFRPVLRGIVVGGGTPQHLRADVTGGRGEPPRPRARPFWFPPAKVAGRYLAPFLTAHGAPRLPSEPQAAVR